MRLVQGRAQCNEKWRGWSIVDLFFKIYEAGKSATE